MRRLLLITLLASTAVAAPPVAWAGKEQLHEFKPTGEGVLMAQGERRRPGAVPPSQREELPTIDPNSVPPPQPTLPRETIPIPDRWRLIEALGVNSKWWDPYNQNTLKGDRPIFGQDWFINISAISDTIYEPRGFPTPTSPQTGREVGAFTRSVAQNVFATTVIPSISLIKGNTAYKPPDLEFRFTPAFQYNRASSPEERLLEINPREGKVRNDSFLAVQEAFIDYHIRNVSDRFDFDSIRVGIQPAQSDFRGFLFQDLQFGARLFGNRANNVYQYNLAWFRRLEKDTNSGLNDVSQRPRDDDIFQANLFVQDAPVVGFTTQFTAIWNRNREDDRTHFNRNDFLERPARSFGKGTPRHYDVVYLGVNGDGHFGRFNLTTSAYYALGKDSDNQFGDNVSGKDKARISAFFLAAEPSIDFSWVRIRGSLLYASGDDDPNDDVEKGFDAIFENPQFAGADTSYWMRQAVPFVGGGGTILTGRNGLLNSLRTSKEEGQSNFNNPGLILIGGGVDFDITPEIRFTTNLNHLSFADTAVLEQVRLQNFRSNNIGWDLSASLIYRPTFIQNIVFRLSGAVLFGDHAFQELFATNEREFYSVLANLTLTY